jgi:hypothetical protein
MSTTTATTGGIQYATKVGKDETNDNNKENKTNETNAEEDDDSKKVDWKEVGIGPLRILTSTSKSTTKPASLCEDVGDKTKATTSSTTARIVQRRESTPGGPGTKLILNVMLKKECVVEKRGDKFIKLAAFEVMNNDENDENGGNKTKEEENDKENATSVKVQTVQYLFKVKTVNDADILLDELNKFCK